MRKSFFLWNGNNKDADQPAHLCSLICIIAIRVLDRMMAILSTFEMSRVRVVFVAE